MRLEKIKLAGFKSFVDPTIIPLPGNLVGIVGPNGCGKSNIIDAVRWVMGESSAKHLRGESMADVIFNGSSSRKPVGLASVELVFDNGDGSAPGEYAKYQQIAIKRQVARDGQSSYFLNGGRCRRKDITDIFLGTGLGARSYAIIEQGTISRLIEAKPDEMREVIEEAAGISRYKERRHETEIRMRHTQENLDRLQDLRDEVAKQLGNLQRQAKKAEKYTSLKEDERRYRQQLLAIRWRKYDQLLCQHQAVLQECEQAFKNLVSEDNALIEALDQVRGRHETLQKSLNGKQGEFYEVGAEISRLDQAIKHAHQTRDALMRERERLQGEQEQALTDLEQDREQIARVREELVKLETDCRDTQAQEAEAVGEKVAAEQALKLWREESDAFKAELARLKGQGEVQRARIRQMEEQQRQLHARQQRLRVEQNELEGMLLEDELESLRGELLTAESERAEVQERLDALGQQVQDERARAKACHEALHVLRAELHTIQGKISSLELLQQHAMGKDRTALKKWLQEASLAEASRLAEHLDVRPGWETAVENVLGLHLEAVCVEDTGRYLSHLSTADHPDSVAFFETRRQNGESARTGSEKLLDCVQSTWSLNSLLGNVYRANDLAQAKAISARLAEHESVVTPDGARLGPGWLAIQKPDDGKAGVLKRERELRELKQHRDELHARAGGLEQDLSLAEESTRQAEFEREQRQSETNRLSAEITQLKSRLSAATARSEQARRRMQQLEFELEDLQEHLLQNAEETSEARTLLEQAEQGLGGMELRTGEMASRQAALESRVAAAESALRIARDAVHALRNRLDTLRSTEALTLKHLERVQTHCQQSSGRLDDLARRLNESGAPLGEEQLALDELREQRGTLERDLADCRRRVADAETEIRKLNEARMGKERELETVKARLEQTKLDYQANEVRRQTVQEQFDEIGTQPEEVIPDLPEDAEEKDWQQKVTQLAEEIARLGPINLTAVEEYEAQFQRMKFLDQQHQDLTESMATLQQAIEKIDRECRARFKDTFDRINAGIQRMFPKLFGGGQAYLELNERDLLETGVSVMARPPGKRNSSIHLLSGGEKALTAVSLVFAIFELNPAPFCLLDEVDAPLDDANVGRFSQLVKEMSERVQFLFISHNKVTMEIAQHLAGVTMKEPGVSRIVAVDIDQAVELAAV
ncbi:MAG TPA: chromosome segregation protein SMC [Methylococcaceae bacterium]|nr:chromosome segregation protein SMC [Methylococcaceae bacterium]